MAKIVKHKFVSAIPDAGDPTIVQPSNWNDDHDITGVAESGANTDITSLSGITGGISSPDFLQLDTAAAASIALGKLRWNAATATAAFGIIDGTTEVNIGEQMYAYVTNAESVTITAGQAVYLYGATGNRASVKLASNLGDATSAKTLGLVTQDIAAGATGFVTTQGVLEKLDTSAFADGTTLYLGATAGSLTSTKPKAPNHLVYIGVVERSNAGNGQIYVRPQNGYELDEIHDVQINSPANGQTILYDASTSLWKNANLTAGTGISISNGAASATITNSAPDQVVSLTGAGSTTVTGTYPNFTISSTGGGGGVTSVTGTAPIASSGGTTPAISISQATTSTDGYLSSTDWNTFNNKQPAGTYVTSVSGTTGRITSTGGTTPVIDLASGVATPGTTGSSTQIPVVTIDTYGRITGITTASNPQGTVTSVAALTLGTTGTDLSSTVANGTTTPVITLNVPTASATNRGALSSADWTTFNNKGNGTVTSVALSAPAMFTVSGSPVTGSGTLALTYSGTALPIANGGTGATTAPAASANLSGFTTTATSGITTTLTSASSVYQVFTGTAAQTVQLPATSTLAQGWSYHIVNNTTNILTVQTSTAVVLDALSPGSTLMPTVLSTAGNTAADWEVGYTDLSVDTRQIQQNAQTGNYTIDTTDIGKHIYHASGAGAAVYTIPANSAVPFEIGTAITFINMSTTAPTIAITTDTMYLAGTGTTGTRTLAQYGVATAIKMTATTWIISGSGLT